MPLVACLTALALLLVGTAATTTHAQPAGRVDLAGAAGHRRPFTVSSTLTGTQTLPHRIPWLAFPKPNTVIIDRVEFLIDGKLSWVENNPPYTYGDDGNWLVTSWLTPGPHRFTVRAVSLAGRTATKTTVAQVVAAPEPPVELDNTRWQRTLPHAGSGGSPAGRWVLSVDKVGWSILDPNGDTNVVDVAYLAPGVLEARGGIYWTPRSEPLIGGNGWCEGAHEPRGTVRYSWTVAGDSLTLALAGPKQCGDENEVWAATWTRIH